MLLDSWNMSGGDAEALEFASDEGWDILVHGETG